MQQSDDERWMHLALALGARGLGLTWPNPAVGCVIVKDGRVVGRGWTQPGGRPHAERMALDQATTASNGATAYVTLEPCAHLGKTPPCANALIDAGIARVVAATGDPDTRVAGKGFAALRAAGIKVICGVLEAEAQQANIGFLTRITQGRPAITLKLASSLDGKIATCSGESQWITGVDARQYVHYLRATHDAVMVGSGTSLVDNPSLNVRINGLEQRKPVRIVLDSTLSTPPDSILAKTAHASDVWMCHGPNATVQAQADWGQTGAVLIECAQEGAYLSLTDALANIANKGITRMFCEGGGKLAASLIKAGFVDRLISFTAGVAIGPDGTPNLGPLGVTTLAKAPRFTLVSQRRIGGELMSEWVPARS